MFVLVSYDLFSKWFNEFIYLFCLKIIFCELLFLFESLKINNNKGRYFLIEYWIKEKIVFF